LSDSPLKKIIASTFRPPWWLRGPHLQTLWTQRERFAETPVYRSERLELPDGDFVDLCWTAGDAGPIVMVFHGLEGDITSPYSRHIMAAIAARGWRGVFMHFRGCSGEVNRLDRTYHSGDTGDIACLVTTLRRRFPDAPLAAVGYSLGGNALLKYLGENRAGNGLGAAVAVSVPFLLDDGARRLDRGLSKFYQRHLLRRLHRKIKTKFRHRKVNLPLQDLHGLKNFRRFDDQVTAPVDDYYRRSSCRQYLARITTPVLIIHSRDDPFMTPAAIPREDELGSGVTLELSDRGGHVGFISGKYPWQTRSWLQQRIPEYLATQLDE